MGTEPNDIAPGPIFDEAGLLTVPEVESHITEFLGSFNGPYRLALLTCRQSEKENLMCLLTTLMKSVKSALDEVGKSLRNQEYHFSCGICDQPILVLPNEDIWARLQDHDHFEQLYCELLNNTLELRPLNEEPNQLTTSDSESNVITEDATTAGDSNTDSGIEQHDLCTRELKQASVSPTDENVNSFRFNFNITYDERIEKQIYRRGTMLEIRKYDKIKDYTIMKIGSSSAACLICHCEIRGLKPSKNMLVNHAMGQKHLKAASEPLTVKILQLYHGFWLKQDVPVQGHIVYFRPYSPQGMICLLCDLVVQFDWVIDHINSKLHRQTVVEMYQNKVNLYYLVPLQVQAYGIVPKSVEVNKQKAGRRERRSRLNPQSDEAKPQTISHNIIKSVEEVEGNSPIDNLPNRMSAEAKYLIPTRKSTWEVIWCDFCKCNLAPNTEALIDHISYAHLERNKYKYYCDVCMMHLKNEFSWIHNHLKSAKHASRTANRKSPATEYECTTCKTVIFGDESSIGRHIYQDKKGKSKGTKLPDQVKTLLQSKEHVLAQADLLVANATDGLTDTFTRTCCARLEADLKEQFPNCKVYPFGSRITGLGNMDSDLDVFVDVGEAYYGENHQDPTEQVTLIRNAVKALSKNKEYLNIVNVLTARTPILKLHHAPTRLDCDLSFKHGLSVENTKFLKFCNELQPMCQQLILLIKMWAGYIGFENISTYAFAVLCIFYLQAKGYLLSVEKIRQLNKVESEIISGWKIIKYALPIEEIKPHIKTYEGTVYEMAQEFFQFYSQFDFNVYVICPLLGRVVQRSLFSEGDPKDLPPEMEAYVAQLENENGESFRSFSYMCVQDPFDLSHNLTKAVQQGTLKKFQDLCKLSLVLVSEPSHD